MMRATGNVWADASVAAETYQSDLVPLLFEPWARELVDLIEPRLGERVLDVACGTGLVARTAAPLVSMSGTVVGIDINADMLAVARQIAPAGGPAITWMRADATNTGLPDAAFDAVLCQQGLQFFPDRRAALRELSRVLVPGGRLALSVWCDSASPGYLPFIPAFERHLTEPGGAVAFVGAIFSLADEADLRDVLSAEGYQDVRITRTTRTVRCPSAKTWVDAFLGAAPIGALDLRTRNRITEDVVMALDHHVDGNGLAFPISAHVASAKRPGSITRC